MTVAGRADSAAVKRIANQDVLIASVDNSVVNGKAVVGAELLVEAGKSIVVIQRLEGVQILRRQAQGDLGSIERAKFPIRVPG